MARLRVFSGRQVCQILERHGFQPVRRRGSHIVMQRRGEETTITVPVPDHPEIKIGTLLSIIRQSNVPRTEFEETRRKRRK
jgi:predicted RNA binding protein YcfA (HicA-like mRNA interferase family)